MTGRIHYVTPEDLKKAKAFKPTFAYEPTAIRKLIWRLFNRCRHTYHPALGEVKQCALRRKHGGMHVALDGARWENPNSDALACDPALNKIKLRWPPRFPDIWFGK